MHSQQTEGKVPLTWETQPEPHSPNNVSAAPDDIRIELLGSKSHQTSASVFPTEPGQGPGTRTGCTGREESYFLMSAQFGAEGAPLFGGASENRAQSRWGSREEVDFHT